MKSIFLTIIAAVALASQARAYLPTEDGALNVRHFHMVKRGLDGEIVDRSFMSTYDIVERDTDDLEVRGRRCTTSIACGTPGGCAMMAAQRYCKGESWEKSFQKAVKQTGANGKTGLRMMAEGMGRGPIGMLLNTAKSTTKAIINAKKGKGKREFIEDELVLNRRDFEVVERDGNMDLVERADYSLFDLVSRGEDGELVARSCEMYNGDVSCL